MEGYIKKIEEQGDTTVLTVHILTPKKPWSPDQEDYSTEEQFEEAGGRYLTEYAKYEAEIKALEHLHLGLIEVKQDEQSP